MHRRWRRRKKLSVILGGERIAVSPLGLEDALRLLFILAPHLAAIERHLPELRAALSNTNGQRPALLTAAVTALIEEMQQAPGDLTRAVALLVGREPEWIATYALAEEVVKALPILDEANDFAALFDAVKGLGLTLRYSTED